MRADQVRKENNLTVAQERESYFKEQLEKARRSYFGLQNSEDFERKTREDAEKKKNSTVDDFYVQGSIQSGFKEVHY